jgi:hypothetical protein
MFPKRNTYIDGEIARTVAALQLEQIDSEEYDVLLTRIEKMQKIRQEEKPDTVTSDALVLAATNLIGIFVILRHENLNVITSKAMSFVPKLRF